MKGAGPYSGSVATQSGTSRRTASTAPAYPISSVGKALDILNSLGDGSQVRVADAARTLGIARSSAHRLLATMEHQGFVQQDPLSRAYHAGRTLIDLGLAAVDRLEVRRVARPHLEALGTTTGETCVVAMLDGTDAVTIDYVAGDPALRVVERPGERYPAHLSAAGKAMLAHMDPAELHRLYPSERLEVATARSLATRSELERDLALVRELGYASNREESDEGLFALGAAIRDSHGIVQGAMAIGIPAVRANDGWAERLGPSVAQAAAGVAQLL
jgi:IclR family acetate operon transcriptional repressor